MANEITLTAGLAATKTVAAINSGTMTKQLTMTGAEMIAVTKLFPADGNGLALNFGLITGAPGAVMVKNLDAANPVTFSIGHTSGFDAGRFAILRAGAVMIFQPYADLVYAKATTAAVRLQIWSVEL